MKKRILQSLLLLGTVAWFSAPFLVAPSGQRLEEKEKLIETACHNEKIETSSWIKGWTTGVVNAKEDAYQDAKIVRVYMEYEPVDFYFYGSMWCAVKLDDEVVYINKDYITTDKVEIEYRQLMDRRTVTEEWFVEYKEFIDLYSAKYDSPETIYDCFTDKELDLLFRVVQAEIGDEYTFEQKVNVCNVIFNRLYSDKRDFVKQDTLLKVLREDQFSTISNGRIYEVKISETTINACEYAFAFEDTTNGALFFDSNGSLNYKKIDNDGAHTLYTITE